MISTKTQSADFIMALEYYKLTPREIDVFMLVIKGDTLDQIGKKLFITSSTVQDHIKSTIKRTESKNRTEMIVKILSLRLVCVS